MKPWQEFCKPENWHEAANLFPLMPDDELRNLADDIKNNGQKNPVITIDDKVLDGRNRLLACNIAGVRPDIQTRNTEKLGSPVAWVLSQNLHRRQLTATQRAFIAVEAEKLFAIEAKQRQGTRTDIKEKIPECYKGQARDKAAEACQVNPRYVQDAKAVAKQSPAVAAQAKAGKISMATAKKKVTRLGNPKFVEALRAHEAAARKLNDSLKAAGIDATVLRSKTDGKFNVTWYNATAVQVQTFEKKFRS